MASDKSATEEARIRKALFGDGTQAGALISKILIGASGSNQYHNIHEVLKRLGIAEGLDRPDHFHIYLNPPKAESIGAQNLLTNALATSLNNTTLPDASSQIDAQGLLDYAQTIIEGEELMFIMDVPSDPPQQTPIVLAQAAAPTTQQPDYILKSCEETVSGVNAVINARVVSPSVMLGDYLGKKNNREILGNLATLTSIKTTLLEDAKHGKITAETTSTGRIFYVYTATPNYEGKDKAIFMAEFEGKHYKIIVELHVFAIAPMENQSVNSCPPPKLIKVNGKPVTGSSGYDSGYSFGSLSVTFADLTGGAVGQTTGTNITLDTNAAGHNWFIDTTPADNSEYLPTSNPYEWVAKAGTAAYGKMDMLSVLLHEYGHALGIEHSADNHDYMATTLTPGVRRMPSAEELALMQELVAQAKGEMVATESTPTPTATPPYPPYQGGGQDVPLPIPLGAGFGMAFIGRMRKGSYGTSIDVVGAPPDPKYAVAANATFANLATPAGWNSQGSVDIASGAATLNEVSTSQTRLSQVFMLNDQDRYLSFTLSGTALDNLTGAPDDAFNLSIGDRPRFPANMPSSSL